MRRIIRTAVILASWPAAFGAAGSPDLFGYAARVQDILVKRAAGTWEGLHLVWMRQDRVGPYSLLLVACLCLAMLEWKMLRRSTAKRERLAEVLAGAVRSGVLEFETGSRPESPNLIVEDEPEEEGTKELQLMPSRRTLLALNQGKTMDEPVYRVVTRLYGNDLRTPSPDRNLLLGVPVALLPEKAKEEEQADPEFDPDAAPASRWLRLWQPPSEPMASGASGD